MMNLAKDQLQGMGVRQGGSPKIGTTSHFLKMKVDRNESSKRLNPTRRRGAKGASDSKTGHVLHSIQ